MGAAVLGILLALGILILSIIETLKEPAQRKIFLDVVGFMIVFGGTVSAAFITFSAKEVLSIAKLCIKALRKNTDDANILVREIVDIARETRGEPRALADVLPKVNDRFLKDGLALVVERMDAQRIEMILHDRIRQEKERNEHSANMLRSLGKYPPALGIIGTVLGIIALLQGLGAQIDKSRIGPAMAVGLVATFYGLVLTNFILMPIGENLALKSQRDLRKRNIAMTAVLLLRNGEAPVFIQEALNSYLQPEQRIDVFNLGQGDSAGGNAA